MFPHFKTLFIFLLLTLKKLATSNDQVDTSNLDQFTSEPSDNKIFISENGNLEEEASSSLGSRSSSILRDSSNSPSASSASSTTPIKTNRPIILIPGVLGSVLEAKLNRTDAAHWACYKKSDWFKIWINSEVLLPQLSDCWIDNMSLRYRKLTKGGVQQPLGVDIRAPNFGVPTGSIDFLDPGVSYWTSLGNYFATMRDKFVNTYGYVEGKDLFAAPYDWRLTPNLKNNFFCDRLKTLITKAVSENNGLPAMLVCHSMGNLFFHYCVEKVWPRSFSDSHIHAYTNIAGPMAGAPKALAMITSGENENIAVLRPNQIRIAERSWPSTYFLLPNPLAVHGTPLFSKKLMEISDFRNYSITEYHEFFNHVSQKDDEFKNSAAMYNEYGGQALLGQVNSLGFKTLCVWGSDLQTTDKLLWKKEARFPDYSPYEPDSVSGDGTVPVWSIATVCENWKFQQKSKNQPEVSFLELSKYDHVSLLHSEQTIAGIVKLMGDFEPINVLEDPPELSDGPGKIWELAEKVEQFTQNVQSIFDGGDERKSSNVNFYGKNNLYDKL